MKVTLDQTYILNGTFYGPGEVDVDADTAKALKARMAELSPKPVDEKPGEVDVDADTAKALKARMAELSPKPVDEKPAAKD